MSDWWALLGGIVALASVALMAADHYYHWLP